MRQRLFVCVLSCFTAWSTGFSAETFRVAAYNVENYLDQPTANRHEIKSEAAKAKIRQTICAMNPDVLALEEMGSTNALLELRASLKADGQDFPYWEHVQGHDPDIHVAILSKLPITARHPHTDENFLLDGQRFSVSRGFADVDLTVGTNFNFTLIVAHLKSRRPVPKADESALRLSEATALRKIIDAKLLNDPQKKIIVLGDFNDVKNSDSTKALIGRGKFKLTDTRPAERNGDNPASISSRSEPRTVTWTHYYALEDSYSRIDYILLSPGMLKYWEKAETYIPMIPNWGLASDHRPVTAAFTTGGN